MDKSNILECRKIPIEYTEDQKTALSLVSMFLDSKQNYFLLSGNAGSGKTTICENIAIYSKATILAPTNSAVRTLREKFGKSIPKNKFMTIHGRIYGYPDPETGKFKVSDSLDDGNYIVDEASMIDQKMLDDLMKLIKKSKGKIIFVGDDFQLEPVSKDPKLFQWENIHKEFNIEWKYKLESVKRNSGTILRIANHIRQAKTTEILNINDSSCLIANQFSKQLIEDIQTNADYVVLVSTNEKRMTYNELIRKKRFGAESNKIENGERAVSVANTLFTNGEALSIYNLMVVETFKEMIDVGTKEKPEQRLYDFSLIRHTISENGSMMYLSLFCSNLDKPSLYPGMLMDNYKFFEHPLLTKYNKYGFGRDQRMWNNEVNILTYGYAISAHKSQGNEWAHVYINSDWLSNAWNKQRWLYTAITRAQKRVEIKISKYTKLINV